MRSFSNDLHGELFDGDDCPRVDKHVRCDDHKEKVYRDFVAWKYEFNRTYGNCEEYGHDKEQIIAGEER